MSDQATLKKICERIQKLEKYNFEEEGVEAFANWDLLQISRYSKDLSMDFKLQYKEIDWFLLERLKFARFGYGFSSKDLIELLVENKYEVLEEFEKVKKLNCVE